MSSLSAKQQGTGGPTDVTGIDWLARARTLAPLIAKHAGDTERLRTLAPEIVDAFRQTGLFWFLVPREAGGGGASLVTLLEVLEEVAAADGSTGWTLMANAEVTAMAAAYCADAAVDGMFGGPEPAIIGGMLGPGGKAVEVQGGYRGSGRFSFGSGCGHASWFGGGMMVVEDGTPRAGPNDAPECQVVFVPRERVDLLDNWHVNGLVGTGSFDYEIPDQFIASDFAFERSTLSARRGSPSFNLGLGVIVGGGHAGVALGLMRRALHEVAKIATAKKRVGYPTVVADNALFRHGFGVNEALYQGARAHLMNVYREIEAMAARGDRVEPFHLSRCRQVATWIHELAADVIKFCYNWTGSQGIRTDSLIGRCFSDMFIATQHMYLDPVTIIDAGPSLLERWQDLETAPGVRRAG